MKFLVLIITDALQESERFCKVKSRCRTHDGQKDGLSAHLSSFQGKKKIPLNPTFKDTRPVGETTLTQEIIIRLEFRGFSEQGAAFRP